MVNFSFRRRQPSRPRSILDLPFSEYDPKTNLPATINIGDISFPPFIFFQHVKDHLTLLGAIHDFRESAGEAYPEICDIAQEEYRHWVQEVLPKQTGELELPPLRVVMNWHSHMLNPRAFDRDCDGPLFRALRGRMFPLREVARALEDGSLSLELPTVAGRDAATSKNASEDTLDVAAAVQRQYPFIVNMRKIGWLDPKWLNGQDGGMSIIRAIVRYYAWLDLMHSTQGKHFLVPTLDIDLAWHTHQLFGKVYKHDSETALNGMFLDHDDSAGTSRLGGGLELTGDLWKEKYGYTYTY